MKRILVTATAILAGTAAYADGPAFVPLPEPVIAAPIQDWSGLYVGLQAGSANGTTTTGGTAAFDVDLSGTLYGAHVGYNFDLGSFVLGAEIDYNVGTVDVTGIRGLSEEFDMNLAHLKARAGYDLNSVLVYGTAGMAFMEISFNGATIDGSGMFYGIGAELKVSDSWTVGAEYLSHQFEEFGGAGEPDVDLQTVQARVSYHF